MDAVPAGLIDAPSPPVPAQADEVGWIEPTSRLPLRWGGYAGRYPVGLTVLLAAALGAHWRFWWNGPGGGSAALGVLLVAGIAVAGIVVMPARAGRRGLAVLVALASHALWWLTDFGLSGAESWRLSAVVTGVLAVLAWLILRERSGRSCAIALPVGAVGVLVLWLAGDGILRTIDVGYHRWLVNALVILGWVGAAWLARALEPHFGRRREERRATRDRLGVVAGESAEAEAVAAQVRAMAALQAAWIRENPGQPMPAIAVAPMARPAGGTNTLAILALVFGLLGGGVVSIVLGHMARAQIRRTGEVGDGMAITGLVLGYIGLVVVVGYLVLVLGLLSSLA